MGCSMIRPHLLSCLLALSLALPGGIVTSGRMATLEGRVSKLEKERSALIADLQREQKRLRRLHDEIERSTGHLRHSGARITTRIDQLEQHLKQLRGELEVYGHRMGGVGRLSSRYGKDIDQLQRRISRLIADLRDRAGIAILALPKDLPEQADDWVKLAQLRFDQGEVRVAEAIAKECDKRFAGSMQAGECGLIRARVYFEEHRFDEAIKTLQAVHDAQGGKAVEVVGKSLLAIGQVLAAEGKCSDALNVLDYLRRDLAKLPQAKLARKRRNGVKKSCKAGVMRLPERTSGSLKAAPVPPPGAASPTGR